MWIYSNADLMGTNLLGIVAGLWLKPAIKNTYENPKNEEVLEHIQSCSTLPFAPLLLRFAGLKGRRNMGKIYQELMSFEAPTDASFSFGFACCARTYSFSRGEGPASAIPAIPAIPWDVRKKPLGTLGTLPPKLAILGINSPSCG